jgi:hypothetical protein
VDGGLGESGSDAVTLDTHGSFLSGEEMAVRIKGTPPHVERRVRRAPGRVSA